MHGRNPLTLIVGCAVLLSAWIATAQTPSIVGDILDRGGKRIGRDDLITLVSGSTISGAPVGRPQTTFENIHKSNGTASGRASNRSAQLGEITYDGTWSVDDAARLCYDFRNNKGETFKNCTVWFVLNDAYYAAAGEDRQAELYLRNMRR